MPAYVVFTEQVHDEAKLGEYAGKAMATMAGTSCKLVAFGEPETIEGDWHGNRTVILQFDSVEDAKAWYNSPEYQEAIPIRQSAADCKAMIIEGLPG